ncbi:MAG: histidine phosphatase family protein [Propionibacteriaceae bacterium]|jgi:broad specificity phosphatase PhoE|nr:histidine phosphatase family protein [Propionibacteriaceae bacterium]
MPIVHLLRHGKVDNPQGVLYERLPGYHLSELGQQMAAVAAQFFKDRPITHLRCSPLERTQETIAPLAALFPELEVILDDRVIEAGNRFAGQVMGSTAKAARSPKNWPYLLNPLRPSWGEAYSAIAKRMTTAILDAAELAGDGEAVIVTHQLPIWVTRRRVERRVLWHDPRKRQCTLASVTSVQVSDQRLVKVDYAEPARALLPDGPQVGF